MRLPSWLRATKPHRVSEHTVQVELVLDVSKFETAMHMAGARAYMSAVLSQERTRAWSNIGFLLDEMCRDLGLDPVTTWRIPRAEEARDRARTAAHQALHSPERETRAAAEAAWLRDARAHQADQTRTRLEAP